MAANSFGGGCAPGGRDFSFCPGDFAGRAFLYRFNLDFGSTDNASDSDLTTIRNQGSYRRFASQPAESGGEVRGRTVATGQNEHCDGRKGGLQDPDYSIFLFWSDYSLDSIDLRVD